jgi:hypothetical protein
MCCKITSSLITSITVLLDRGDERFIEKRTMNAIKKLIQSAVGVLARGRLEAQLAFAADRPHWSPVTTDPLSRPSGTS